MAPIAGTVANAPPGARIVVYAHTDAWYVQPYVSAPYTKLQNNNRWTTSTHLGTEYAALLVRPTYQPNARTDALPRVSSGVLAIVKQPGRQ